MSFDKRHWDPVVQVSFVQLWTSEVSAPLELSDDHLVLSNDRFVPANQVAVGDELQLDFGERAIVARVSRSENHGVYAPITESGDLLVSVRISLSQHLVDQFLARGSKRLSMQHDRNFHDHGPSW